MEYIFTNEKGIEERVEEERWGWGVVYKDDSELHQFGNDGKFHRFAEIQMDNVKLFSMYNLKDMSKRIDIVLTEAMQIFHFYRNIKPWYLDSFVKVYVFGYKNRETGETCYNFILPDDRIIITSNKDNIDLVKFNIGA